MMYRPVLLIFLLISLVQRNDCQDQQLQMPDMAAMTDSSASVEDLQKNISALWTYIYELRGAVTGHLNHLRQHQIEMEETIHRIEHHHDDTHAAHTADHSHSGENSHSHGSDHHSHSGEHHHSGEQHSHSGEQHSHGDSGHSHGDGGHSHGDGGHSHDGDDHSHGSDAHSHGDGSHGNYREDHYHSHSHSHSHTDDEHGSHSDHDHHHGHDHKDSHESVDDLQQTSQVAEPLVEPVIVPTRVNAHSHNDHHAGSRSSGRSGQSSQDSGSSTFQPISLTDGGHHHHHSHHHSHGSTSSSRTRNRTVVMPKYSEYDLYEFAVCNVKPNRAIPDEQQQNVIGQVSFWQKKVGGPLNIHVRLSGFEMGDHHAHHQQQQQEEDNETPVTGGHKHGFHIHASGDLSNGCQSAGPHYNPKTMNHGGPNDLVRHVGDLGNIECDDHGVANIVFSDDFASLKGQYSIVGKALVIHAKEDDLGTGGDDESLRTGNAGARLACCVVQKVDKLPIRLYKAMKTAVQYQNR